MFSLCPNSCCICESLYINWELFKISYSHGNNDNGNIICLYSIRCTMVLDLLNPPFSYLYVFLSANF